MTDLEILLSTKEARKLDATSMYNKDDTIAAYWNAANSLVDYVGRRKSLTMDTKQRMKYFVLADYLTYVPFGSIGYNELDKELKSTDGNNSVEQYRLSKYLKIIKSTGFEIPEAALNLINKFFLTYNDNTKSYSSVLETATIICRILHECESKYGQEGYENLDKIKSKAQEEIDKSLNLKSIDIQKIIEGIVPLKVIDENQKNYMLTLAGLEKEKKQRSSGE